MPLKRIRRQDVRLGMYIERLEGDWLDHPFWRSGFVLSAPSDVEKLINSAVDAVVIDEAKGVAVAARRRSPSKDTPEMAAAKPRPSRARAPLTRVENSILQCGRAVGQIFAETRMGRRISPDDAAKVIAQITATLDENPVALSKLTRLKSIDNYTYLHSIGVSALMLGFSRHLKFDEETVQLMGLAGLMHDIGKVVISPMILTKPSALTSGEIEIVRTHPAAGHEILMRNGFPDLVQDVALHHHERVDGSGYPKGLGTELSAHARIAAICDVYDAVTSIRPYKRAWTPIEALTQMAGWKGHFDPALFGEFMVWLNYDETKILTCDASDVPFAVNGYSDPTGGATG